MPNPVLEHRLRRRIGWAAWGLSCLLYLGDLYLLIVNGSVLATDPSVPFAAVQDLAFVVVASLALVIIRSQPTNMAGWWIMVVGISWPLESFAVGFASYGADEWGITTLVLIAAWVGRWAWIGGQVNLPFTLLYYPDGRLPSRRWRPVAFVMWAVLAVAFVLVAFARGPIDEVGGLENPVGLLPRFDDSNPLGLTVLLVLSFLPVVGLLSLVLRFRGSSGVVRQQLKAMLWVAVVAALFFASQGLIGDALSSDVSALLNTAFTLFVIAVITAAIVRYKVFEIDRLISRTVSYAIVVVVLAGVFFGLVTVAATFLPSRDPLVIAASTLVAAALFNPLRRSVQHLVDRRFNRARYDSDQIVDEFSGSLREQIDPEETFDSWVDVVTDTMQPAAIGVWVKES